MLRRPVRVCDCFACRNDIGSMAIHCITADEDPASLLVMDARRLLELLRDIQGDIEIWQS